MAGADDPAGQWMRKVQKSSAVVSFTWLNLENPEEDHRRGGERWRRKRALNPEFTTGDCPARSTPMHKKPPQISFRGGDPGECLDSSR